MDYFQKLFAQLVDTWRSLSSQARLVAVGAAVVVLLSGGYLINQQANGTSGYLMGGESFSPAQLRDMEAAFGKAGLSNYQVEGARIKVSLADQSKFMAALAESGALPMEPGDFLQKAVNASGMTASRSQQEAAMKVAGLMELQNTLNQMDGVKKSAVHIDKLTDRGFPPKDIMTASVSIMPRGNQPLDESRVGAIRHMVSSWVAGLKPEAVTIIDLSNGRPYPGTGGVEKGAALVGDYAELKRYYEREYQQNINRVLAYIPGVLVTTNVELDPEVSNEQTSVEYDANRSVVYESRDKTTNGKSGKEEESDTQQRKAVPTTQRRVVREGLTPKRVTASVAVPNAYYEKIWQQLNPPTVGQGERRADPAALADIQQSEKRKIEELVAGLLPQRPGSSETLPQVAVSTFYQFPEPPAAEPTWRESLLEWVTNHGTTLGMIGVALAGLIVLRSLVRSALSAPPRLSAVIGDAPANGHPLDESTLGTASTRPRPRRAATSLRDELVDIVRDDPDAAVSVLRSWIGNAN